MTSIDSALKTTVASGNSANQFPEIPAIPTVTDFPRIPEIPEYPSRQGVAYEGNPPTRNPDDGFSASNFAPPSAYGGFETFVNWIVLRSHSSSLLFRDLFRFRFFKSHLVVTDCETCGIYKIRSYI